jgi:hypothetical protein
MEGVEGIAFTAEHFLSAQEAGQAGKTGTQGGHGGGHSFEIGIGIVDDLEQAAVADASTGDLIGKTINESGVKIIYFQFSKFAGIETVSECIGVAGLAAWFSGHKVERESSKLKGESGRTVVRLSPVRIL